VSGPLHNTRQPAELLEGIYQAQLNRMRPVEARPNYLSQNRFSRKVHGIKRKQYRLFPVKLMRKKGMAGHPALTCVSAPDVRPVTQAIKLGQCAAHGRPPSLTAFGTYRRGPSFGPRLRPVC
jgi:hypothetical protein